MKLNRPHTTRQDLAVQHLLDVLEDAQYEPRSYSGRGMNGEQCVGVVTDDSESEVVMSAINAVEEQRLEPTMRVYLRDLLKGTRRDDMGRSTVYYWPGAPWPEGLDG